MTLRAKVSLALSGLLVLSIGTTGGVLLYESARTTRREVSARHQLIAENRAFALHDNFEILSLELTRLAELPQINFADKNPLPESQLLDSAHHDSVLYNTAVLLIAADGSCVGATPDLPGYRNQSYRDRPWFIAARSGERGPFFRATDEPAVGRTLKIVAPIRRDHRFVGVLVGMIALEEQNLISPALREDLPPATEAILVDELGRIVYPPDRGMVVSTSDWATAIARAHAGNSGTFSGTSEGVDSLFAYAPVKAAPGFALVFRWPWSSLVGELRKEAWVLLGILLAGIVLAAVAGLAFATYFTRPLEALSESARRIARDDPSRLDLPPASSDELGTLVRAFEQMAEAIRSRDRELRGAMSKTAAMVGHELKNSLNGLGMAVELILQDPANAARVGRLRTQVVAEVTRLRDVVDSLLSFSRTPRITRAPEDLSQVIRRAVEALKERIEDRGAEVTIDVPPEMQVVCDGYKIQGVIINLVKNAVEAGKHAWVRAYLDGADAIVEITDDGPGLSDEARQRLFEPFFTTKPNGTGLGLPVSLRYAEAHGGRLEAGSAGEGGARFRLCLPREATPATGATETATDEVHA